MLEDFVYWGLSLMVCEPEGGKSHATAFEVGLTLGESEYIYIRTPNLRYSGTQERKEILGLPNGNEYFILRRFGERARVDISGYIPRFDCLEIDESLFRIDPAHVHLAGVGTEQRIITPIPTGGCGGLRPAPVRLLRW